MASKKAQKYTTILGETIEYPAPPADVDAFLSKCVSATNDPRVSEADLTDLIYGKRNPLLDQTVFPGRGAVTREVFANPVYQVMQDLLDQKRVLEGKLDPKAAKASFTVTVSEAAEQLGISVSAARQACQAGRLTSVKRGKVHYIDPHSIETYRQRVTKRGPAPSSAAEPSLRVRMGSKPGASFSVKAANLQVVSKAKGALEAVVPSFSQAAVRFSGKQMNRFFLLVPSEEENRFEHAGFYVEGRYQVAEKVNGAREASERFKAFGAVDVAAVIGETVEAYRKHKLAPSAPARPPAKRAKHSATSKED